MVLPVLRTPERSALAVAAGADMRQPALLLILAGGLYMLASGIITWHSPVAVLAGLAARHQAHA